MVAIVESKCAGPKQSASVGALAEQLQLRSLNLDVQG